MSSELTTERLIVREFTLGDLDDLSQVFGDPRVLWWEPAPWTCDQTRGFIERCLALYADDGFGEHAIVVAESGKVIGDCGTVFREIEGERLPELGWDLRSDMWGKGYATEAARAMVAHMRTKGLPRVYSLIEPHYAPSQAVARRLGMEVEREVVWSGLRHDLWWLDLA